MGNHNRQMSLGAMMFYPSGENIASWRHPKVDASQMLDFDYYKNIVQAAERAKFDLFFYADNLYVWDRYDSSIRGANSIRPEPITLMAALASVTKHIGLAPTISTSYNEPYHIARKMATLDHFSKGRTAWNVITSSADEEAQNFNKETHLEHSTRYRRAAEFVDITLGLFDSWEEDSIVMNKESGEFADPEKVHYLNHSGEFFKVRGPLNVSRPPQGHPVLVQAGASESGKELAARTAEIIFSPFVPLEDAKAFYRDVKGRLSKYGREPHEVKIMPSFIPIVGRTEAEAKEQLEIVGDLIPDALCRDLLSHYLGQDISHLSLDEPLPFIPSQENNNQSKSRIDRVIQLLEKERLTPRQLFKKIYNNSFAGTPEQVADVMETYFKEEAADGFIMPFAHLPGGLDDFIELVLPELRRRGLFRTEYPGGTLRDTLGLTRPVNRYSR
ncbi:LLM class flavin-dependent oxidoreductase [Paenibacillus sp. NPDC057934]|uniref:LLM class flavin-dependent oxidoreductase n=1 Tax=Paenibacillus sp. NPDC057934 TaxID=3346282 RepID=UPI0036DCCECE